MCPKWITIPYIPQNSALYIFEKEFYADGLAESFIIKASADTKYRLFINDTEVLNGPCLGSGFVKYFEETDCSRFLINGKNKITAQVFHAATYDHFGVMPRGVKPAFFFEGILATEKGEKIIVSDESFSVMLVKNIAFFY